MKLGLIFGFRGLFSFGLCFGLDLAATLGLEVFDLCQCNLCVSIIHFLELGLLKLSQGIWLLKHLINSCPVNSDPAISDPQGIRGRGSVLLQDLHVVVLVSVTSTLRVTEVDRVGLLTFADDLMECGVWDKAIHYCSVDYCASVHNAGGLGCHSHAFSRFYHCWGGRGWDNGGMGDSCL